MVVDRLRRLPERAADLRARGRLGEVAQDLHALGLEQRVGLFDLVDVERVEHLQTQLYVLRDIPACVPTVRDATYDVLRRLELTTIFSNPGSTEVPFLAGLPDDLRFVLALHEGSVVSIACGYAMGRGDPRWRSCTARPGWGTRSRRSPPRA